VNCQTGKEKNGDEEANSTFLARATGVNIASRGIADMKVLRPDDSKPTDSYNMNSEYWYHLQMDVVFYFVMAAELTLISKQKDLESPIILA
jgi:hypothetical protein